MATYQGKTFRKGGGPVGYGWNGFAFGAGVGLPVSMMEPEESATVWGTVDSSDVPSSDDIEMALTRDFPIGVRIAIAARLFVQ